MPKKSSSSSKVDTSKTSVPPTPVETSEPPNGHDEFFAQFTGYLAKLQEVSSLMQTLRADFKQLEKSAHKEYKALTKLQKKKKKTTNRKPSGFVKPTLISKELANFLGQAHGTEMARTEVTREINKYIRENKLQDKDNGRKINPDKNLKKLLKLGGKDELTYFNLQKYMSPHFAKAGMVLTAEFK